MDVYLVGTGSTRFARHPDRSFRDLATEAVDAALRDAGDVAIEQVFFGNCAMDRWGQANLRGQVALQPLIREGRLAASAPITNVEAGCSTGSVALHGALDAVAAGSAEVALAVGVEKVFFEGDPAATLGVFASGIDRMHPGEWERFYAEQAEAHGVTVQPDPWRVLFLDLHAAQAEWYAKTYGATPEQLAAVAAKSRKNGANNPRAQRTRALSVDEVLADKRVVGPLTRAMCCPVSDGAAAAVVVSGRRLRAMPGEVRDRAVRVAGWGRAGGTWRDLAEPSVTRPAAERAYERAGIGPSEVDIAEVHDATVACELLHLENLGLMGPGEAAERSAAGDTAADGALPVNPSGGLVAKGHPLGATGLGMIDELVRQLRGEAGALQVRPGGRLPRIALQHNAGGQVGWDEAVAAVALLVGPSGGTT